LARTREDLVKGRRSTRPEKVVAVCILPYRTRENRDITAAKTLEATLRGEPL